MIHEKEIIDQVDEFLDELSPKERKKLEREIREQLALPEIFPQEFDKTLSGWLYRISLWGDLKIYYKAPHRFKGRKKITPEEFLERVAEINRGDLSIDPTLFKKKNSFKIVYYDGDIGEDGEIREERFLIRVKPPRDWAIIVLPVVWLVVTLLIIYFMK